MDEKLKRNVEILAASAATGLFAAQTVGLIRFPGAPPEGWTIGEIESKVTFAFLTAMIKLEELSPGGI